MSKAPSRSNASKSPPDLLLTTKFYIPSTHADLVSRPRLLDHLNQGMTGRLTLVSAPPGFGKTTLLCEWIAHTQEPSIFKFVVFTWETGVKVRSYFRTAPQAGSCADTPAFAWLSLDVGDDDPVRFLGYVTAALQAIAPVGNAARDLLRLPQAPPVETVLTSLVNELCALTSQDGAGHSCVLILDDYHVIDAPAVHGAMTFLLDNLPPCLHLVIATRADPPLPLARWRHRGQLNEIRTDDLRFTPDESATFLNRVMGLDLSAENMATLESRTEGWIVGLQMAAISLQGRSDAAAFIQAFSGSHHYVLDYLVEQVLSLQPEDVQTFLLQTSILGRLVGPLCDAVTGRTGSQAVLERLEKANLFLVSLDDDRRWYRYHHLFRDVLRVKLRCECSPEEIRALHRSASQWYEQHSQTDRAVRQALQGKDFDRVAALLERFAGVMLQRGELMTLLQWLRALPDPIVRASPRLSMLHAWTLLASNQLEAVEPRLQDAERALGLTAEQAASDPTLPTQLPKEWSLGLTAIVRLQTMPSNNGM